MFSKKVIVILGSTASGKTELAVKLAHRFNGEIVSADSRQVYKGMDVGTGKDLNDYVVKSQILNLKSQINLKIQSPNPKTNNKLQAKSYKLKAFKIPYHLIDIVSPKKQFTVAEWQRLAYQTIDDILARGKVPIVVGGTGLYISALTESYVLPQSQSLQFCAKGASASGGKAQNLREKLKALTLKQLLVRLKKIDSATYAVIDKKNRRRVERALEIFYQSGIPKSQQIKKQKPPYEFLLLGVKLPKEKLKARIRERLLKRLRQGMIQEVAALHRKGLSWQRLESFGLEYRFVARYLQGKLTDEEMKRQLEKAIIDFSRRQMTWFKRDQNIKWLDNYLSTVQEVKRFLAR